MRADHRPRAPPTRARRARPIGRFRPPFRSRCIGDRDRRAARRRDRSRRGPPREGKPGAHPRHRPIQSRPPIRRWPLAAPQRGERGRRGAERTRHPEPIAGASSVAAQRSARGDLPEQGDGDGKITARQVAADQSDPVLVRDRKEAIEKALEPFHIGLGEIQGEKRMAGARPHRGEIGKVHRERLPAHVGGVVLRGEMTAREERIAGRHEPARGRFEQRGIIADAQDHAGPASDAARDPRDEFTLSPHRQTGGGSRSAEARAPDGRGPRSRRYSRSPLRTDAPTAPLRR